MVTSDDPQSTPNHDRLAWFLLVYACLSVTTGAGGIKRPITANDLMRFTWAADPRIAPDGSQVAFVKVAVDADKDDYVTSIWLVPVLAHGQKLEPRRLTNGPRDTAPRWSPDGTRLIFARATEKDGKPQPPQLYLLSLRRGRAQTADRLAQRGLVAGVVPRRQNSRLSERDHARRHRQGPAPRKGKNRSAESDVRVVIREEFRRDNAGYRDVSIPTTSGRSPCPDDRHTRRCLTRAASTDERPVRRGRAHLVQGRQAALFPSRIATSSPTIARTAVRSISFRPTADRSGKSRASPARSMIWRSAPTASGSRFAARSASPRVPLLSPISTWSTPRPAPCRETSPSGFDGDIGSGLTGDQRPPRGGAWAVPVWSRDQTAIIDVAAERGRANLVSIDVASGKVTQLTQADQEVIAFNASADGSRLAVLAATATGLGELFLVEPGAGSPERLTSLNAKLFAELDITPPEEIEYASFDGQKIHAWIQKPPAFQAGTRYPLILNIHGGPHAAYGHTFSHEFHLMAAWICRLLPQPAGEQQLRLRVRQHHPVPISWRRLQGPDGWRGRARAARDRRPKAAGRDGW